jgi:hypothetical protein
MGFEPTNVWIRNTAHHKPLYRNGSFWKHDSDEVFEVSMHQPFCNFIYKFKAAIPFVQKLEREEQFSCKVYVIVKINGGSTMPAIYIPEETLSILSAIKCSIDLEMYDNRQSGLSQQHE